MKTLCIERSTGSCRDGTWTESLDLEPKPDRIIVGMGPGSFAGIRAALAFAQGYALGSGCEVLGLPSPCAVIGALLGAAGMPPQQTTPRGCGGSPDQRGCGGSPHQQPDDITVVGDARQGKIWLAAFDGWKMKGEVRQVEADELATAVSPTATVVSPDDARLGVRLAELFGARYRGEALPTAEGLAAYAARVPSALVREPLPIYLNPAVRT